MGYLGYYAAWMLLSYGLRQPWLLAGVVVLWLLRGFIPRPGALFGAFGRAGRLRQQVSLNRANITARRDLASIYLDLLRPRRALELLEEGLALAPEDAELLYLSGLALHRAGRHQTAVERLIRALDKDQRLRHGHPYFVAGDALLALGRWDDAIDAYERFLDFNSSDVAGHTQLSRAQAGAMNQAAAHKALLGAIQTWHALPGPLKRRHFGAYLRAQGARITVLKQPLAMVFAVAGLALLGYGASAAYPVIARLWEPDQLEALWQRQREALTLCGSQSTGDFAGRYDAVPELPRRGNLMPALSNDDETGPEAQDYLEAQKERYANFEVQRDRIVSGTDQVQEFCLSKVLERTPQLLRAEAMWQIQRHGIRGGQLVEIRLIRSAAGSRFSFSPVEYKMAEFAVSLQRKN